MAGMGGRVCLNFYYTCVFLLFLSFSLYESDIRMCSVRECFEEERGQFFFNILLLGSGPHITGLP